MSALPAEICNLKDRGYLKPGCAADMVLLNPAEFRDMATFRTPHAPANGIYAVFVNGALAFRDGKVLAHAGRGLRIGTDQTPRS
jgi:N-acyl-D-aspartate/D-glutamate deacylase